MGSVCPGESQLLKESRHLSVDGSVAFSAGLVSQGTSDVGLARAGGPGHADVLGIADPATACQLSNDRFVEGTFWWVVDALDAGLADLELCFIKARLSRLFSRWASSASTSRPKRSSNPSSSAFGVVR